MPKAVKIKEGAEYLHEIDIGDLERMHGMLPAGKPRQRVQAAILRKKGMSVGAIGAALGENPSTIHNWLLRLAEGACNLTARLPSNVYLNRQQACSREEADYCLPHAMYVVCFDVVVVDTCGIPRT